MNGHAPKALLFQHKETILTLGVIIAKELFARGIPVVTLSPEGFSAVADAKYVTVTDGTVIPSELPPSEPNSSAPLPGLDLSGFHLSEGDHRFLAGEYGEAGRLAMRNRHSHCAA